MAATVPLTSIDAQPVVSIEDAVTRMQSIAEVLPATDGIACFNRMYLTVTDAVRGQVSTGFFADPEFMSRLDVTFVNRYLAALSSYQVAPASAPHSWRALFDNRAAPDVAPMQFALAGMNAHINYDLAPALTQTCVDCSTGPDQGAHHADFEKVNQTLDALDPQVRQSFEHGALLALDRQFAGLDDLVDGFSITAAREAAWVNAEVLWRLRSEPPLAGSFLATVDRTVGLVGRTLLTRLPRL